jgi:hypothetical protein
VVDGKLQTTRVLNDSNNEYHQDVYRLDCCWHEVQPTETRPLSAVTVMPGQRRFLGVTRDGALLYKSELNQPWMRAANSNAYTAADAVGLTVNLRSVTMLPNGTLLGIRKDENTIMVKGDGSSWPLVKGTGSSWPSFLDPDMLAENATRSGNPFSSRRVVWP